MLWYDHCAKLILNGIVSQVSDVAREPLVRISDRILQECVPVFKSRLPKITRSGNSLRLKSEFVHRLKLQISKAQPILMFAQACLPVISSA